MQATTISPKYIFSLIFILLLGNILFANENLLENGSFEEVINELPDGWATDIYGNDSEGVRFYVETIGAYSGNRYITIENIRPNDSKLIQRIEVKPNTLYRLSCRIKADGIGNNALGANISLLDIVETSRDFKDTNDKWEYVELYGRTGSRQKEITVTARLGGYGNINTGKASFDDFRLEEISVEPQDVSIIKFYREQDGFDKQQFKPFETTSSLLAIIIGSLVALILLSIVIYFALFKRNGTIRIDRVDGKPTCFQNQIEPRQTSLTKKDYIIVTFMTLAYFVLALINLGSFRSPQTFWKPAQAGESFYVDLGEQKEIGRINYFLSLGEGSFKLEFSEQDRAWQNPIVVENKTKFEPVGWRYITCHSNARYVKLTCEKPGAMLNEIVLLQSNSKEPIPVVSIVGGDSIKAVVETGKSKHIFDEQKTLALYPNFKNSMYFDEVYFARTGYEHLHALEPTETTHPPLGKNIIATGIAVFGMTPFGWRIMGVLFGAALVPIMYLFSFRVFRKTRYAFIASLLLVFEFMHFSLSRISNVDVFAVFFIFLMYYFMYQYFNLNFCRDGLKKTLLPLLFSGIFMGLAVACKWIALYGALGLAVIFFTSLGKRFFEYIKVKRIISYNQADKTQLGEYKIIISLFPRYVTLTLLWCIIVFILIPCVIYLISYIPFMQIDGPGHELSNVISCQKHMYDYHSKLQASHPFSSTWWQWPVISKPIWAYMGTENISPDKVSSIVIMGNPAIWWAGSLAIIICFIISIVKKKWTMYVILIAVAALYIPWILAPRKLLFIYHFYAVVPFMILCLTYAIKCIIERFPKLGYLVYLYLTVAVVLFVMFYPILSGAIVNKLYVTNYLKWFDSWIF